MTIKISQLANLTGVQANTVVPVVSNITGTLTTVQANVQQLRDYIVATGVSANITALFTNAATQSDLIIGINSNVTQANLGMKGYVDSISGSESIANVNMKGYVDGQITAANTGVTTSNIGIKGYVDQANSIQSAQINAANIGIIGYIDLGNTSMKSYVNGQITAANAGVTSANVGMKGYVDNQTYSNVQVNSLLPTYSGNIGGLFVTNPLVVFGNITAGYAFPTASFANVIFTGGGLANGYAQLNIQNVDSVGTQNSSDFIATAPNGTDSTHYIDMGINGNNYSSGSWTISGANDGYVYINQGNLTLGTDTAGTTVKVHVGGTLADNVVATFSNSNVTIGGNLIVSNAYVPTANNSVGTKGQISYDSSYVYVCIADNNWRRANISTW
jgi:hypothetical protein